MIARRRLLALLGMVPFMGTPQRPDQTYDPPVSGLAPSSQSGVFVGRRVVVSASGGSFSGVFVYSPKPGAGNLIASVVPQAGIDPYGNVLLPGVATYGPTNSYVEVSGSIINFHDASGHLWQIAPVVIGGVSYFQFEAGTGLAGSLFLQSTGVLVAQHPGSFLTPETWQDMTSGLNFGFAAGSNNPRFRLEPDNTVRLSGVVDLTANQVANAVIVTLPTGYRPSRSQFFICANQLSGASAQNTSLEIDPNGNLSIQVAGSNGNTLALDGVTYTLD